MNSLKSPTCALPVLRVALDTPLRRLFDYLAPPGDLPPPGVRVRVPFGRQRRVGFVLQTAAGSELPAERLKPILDVLDESPLLDPGLLALVDWAAGYYHHPIGQVIAAALPRALREGAPTLAREERWRLTPAGARALADSPYLQHLEKLVVMVFAVSADPAVEALKERFGDRLHLYREDP
ncbi:MAG: hypothetical protein JOZ03_10680 [Gammaproteobacteria bacterium]|nr:hypothetical protein [Gammaproteobacteria bacterium]